MDNIEAIKLMIKMRELGITQEQVEQFKNTYKPTEIIADADETLNKLFPNDMTDEELMYYSTPYYDELQALKELKNQKIKDEVRE